MLLTVILVFGTASAAFAAGTPDTVITDDRVILADENDTEQAKDAAVTEEQLARIKRSELSRIYCKANAKKDRFSLTNPKRFDEKVRLYEMFEEYGIHMI